METWKSPSCSVPHARYDNTYHSVRKCKEQIGDQTFRTVAARVAYRYVRRQRKTAQPGTP